MRDVSQILILGQTPQLWNHHSKKQSLTVRLLGKACRKVCYRSKKAGLRPTKPPANGLETEMVRPRSKSRDDLISSAMWAFWKKGFASTTVADLVKATGVGRGGIYTDFGGKDELFLSCLAAYRQNYADPALAVLASADDDLSGIEAYFDFFIELHKHHGMPGPGCFLANTMTELAPHDEAVREVVNKHALALHAGFLKALERSARARGTELPASELDELAGFLATASQGLWSYGRSIHDVDELERFKSALLKLLHKRLA
ncbi:TetR/AcrR family transcriptional regulator [Henriciella sp.]|uniref:TetR/AcrR family transcriptional regulator n=1 Tax=Henriciella sp. TaxID=1968823 RepID=UPI0017C823E9|nr:TetR/AcrR family transcriptional regulator [Henriciella sp.]HIG22170.1 TetR/AcrR family transcriptional regulator [Henriciella sp.]